MTKLLPIVLIILATLPCAFSQVPTSPRSLEAITRTIPALETELDEKNLQLGSLIYIRIFKEEDELEMWIKGEEDFTLFKTYDICHYSGGLGPKTMSGDRQSPEGFYFVNAGRMNPWSTFHLSMNIGYPNRYDRGKGYTGDYLMIHGDCVSIGCYAMTNPGIEQIYTLAVKSLENAGSFFRVHIFPFRMTEENLQNRQGHEWYSFWENLKEGYDLFEVNQSPPNVEVENNRYVFD